MLKRVCFALCALLALYALVLLCSCSDSGSGSDSDYNLFNFGQ